MVAEDAAVLLELQSQLQALSYRVCGTAHSQREALDLVLRCAADILVVDASSWEGGDVLALCEEASLIAEIPSVLIHDRVDAELLSQARAVGVEGVVVRPIATQQLWATLEYAHARPSGASVSGSFAVDLRGAATPELCELSAREREVFELLTRGYRVAEVARKLFISPHTARKHGKTIFRKLQVHSQLELMRRHGRSGGRQS